LSLSLISLTVESLYNRFVRAYYVPGVPKQHIGLVHHIDTTI